MAASAALGAPKLIIVDDDRSLGVTLIKILQKAGYDVRLAATGSEAIKFIREDHEAGRAINSAMIDVRLPDMNGVDVLREIRKLHPDTGVIMMTGNADTASAIGALNEGAFAYLLKPYSIDDVKAILTRAIERQNLMWENRQLLEQLLKANSGLEEKISARTGELRQANLLLANVIERLKAADEVKTKFVSMVSHELRTPLTIIIGFAQTLLRNKGKISWEKQEHYLDVIYGDALRLSRLIEDVLSLANIRDSKIHLTLTKFDLRRKLALIVEEFQMVKKRMKFELHIEKGINDIVSDQDRLEQIMVNLLGNAAKYSPIDGLIKIDARREGGDVVFSIADSGPGIAEEEREKIFQAFYRTQDAINMKSPGTGLGLTITKALVEAFGGRISVALGEGGKGSVFSFAIPSDPHKRDPVEEPASHD